MCEDSDVQTGKCYDVYPTDPLLWCDECKTEVEEAANGTAGE